MPLAPTPACASARRRQPSTMPISIRALVCAAIALGASAPAAAQDSADPIVTQSPDLSDRIIRTALADSSASDRSTRPPDSFGPRLRGSQRLEQAIDWVQAEMTRDGLDNPRTDPVKVPHWVRGAESAELI